MANPQVGHQPNVWVATQLGNPKKQWVVEWEDFTRDTLWLCQNGY
jgi:hypothetical protein